MAWYVYMLRCEADTLYTGSTDDLPRRLRQHLSLVSGGAKYTRSHPPKALAALWSVPDAHAARSLEWHLKRLPRAQKLAVLASPEALSSAVGACAEGAEPLDVAPYHTFFTGLP